MNNFLESLRTVGVYIFGAGGRGIGLLPILEDRKIPVKAFIDNNKEKQGTTICKIRCIDIETAINELGNCYIIVASRDAEDIIFEQLEKNGINMNCVYSSEKVCKAHWMYPIIEKEGDFNNVHPFNFYESPYPDLREIHKKEAEVFDYSKKVLDVDFNISRQFELLKQMNNIELLDWGTEKKQEYRYFYENGVFDKGSADILYYMIRILKPKRIIEVGSGFSTAVMLDTNTNCFDDSIEINCIEPNAERLKSLLRTGDRLKLQECGLQDVPLEFFEQLKENDILFIDSTHVAKIDSDVNYYLFEILPRLAKGVYIHFHDVFYPFIYPKDWIYAGTAYNEMYLLRAFLMNNNKYSVQFFGEMLMREYPNVLSDKMKDCHGSLWIRKDF